MSAAELAAVESRIQAVPLRVWDTTGAEPAYPYVVVYGDAGIRSSDRESEQRTVRSIGWQTTVVAANRNQCRLTVSALAEALEDWTPTVPGRHLSKVDHEGSQPVRPDRELPDRVLYIATDQWRVVSEPGA